MNRFAASLAAAVLLWPAPAVSRDLILTDWEPNPSLIRLADVTYNDIARQPDAYAGDNITVTGEVVEAIQRGNDWVLRLRVSPDHAKIVYVEYMGPTAMRLLRGDIVEISGVFAGIKSYTTVLGATVQLPFVRGIKGDLLTRN